MLINIIQLVIGIALLAFSGERFIEASALLAKRLNVSPLIIGLVIVGFGTSAPELIVSTIAAIYGNYGIAVGNAIGSNITNVALVIGLTALVKPLAVQSNILKREFPILFAAMLAVFYLFYEGVISRADGVLMCFGMAIIIYGFYLASRNKPNEQDALTKEIIEQDQMLAKKMSHKKMIFWLIFGLILLPVSADILVRGATGIAAFFGVSQVVIGLTVVAFGTSLPELAATIISALKDEPDIAVGNVIGSNLFNLLMVLGVPAIIHPLPIDKTVLYRDYPVMVGLSVILFLMCFGKGKGLIKRWHGLGLVAIYVVYIVSLVVVFYR